MNGISEMYEVNNSIIAKADEDFYIQVYGNQTINSKIKINLPEGFKLNLLDNCKGHTTNGIKVICLEASPISENDVNVLNPIDLCLQSNVSTYNIKIYIGNKLISTQLIKLERIPCFDRKLMFSY
jgi:hypothetical protein